MKLKLENWWLLIFMGVLLFTVFSMQAAGDSDSDDDDVMNPDSFVTDVDVMTDVTISGDDVLAFSVGSLGAAAIKDCLATTQFALFIIFKKQGVQLDNWCVAKDMDRAGKHEAAAALRCTYSHFSKLYGDDCTATMNFEPTKPPPDLTSLYTRAAQYDERYEQQQELEQQVEEQAVNYAMFMERFERKERADAAAAKKIRQQKAEDIVYLRGLVNELKALNQGEASGELAQADE